MNPMTKGKSEKEVCRKLTQKMLGEIINRSSGEPYKIGKKDATVRIVLMEALDIIGTEQGKTMDKEEKYKRHLLCDKIVGSKATVELSADEIVMVKDSIDKFTDLLPLQGVGIYGRMIDIIDPPKS